MQTHAKKYENIDHEFARKVKKHFYVDDLNSGTKSTAEGFEFYKKVKSRFQKQVSILGIGGPMTQNCVN